MMGFYLEMLENDVEKGEIPGNQYFLLFPHAVLKKTSLNRVIE